LIPKSAFNESGGKRGQNNFGEWWESTKDSMKSKKRAGGALAALRIPKAEEGRG